MLHKRVTPTERVYHKLVEPSLGSFRAIPHASHCCVRYHPSLVLPKSAPPLLISSASGGGGTRGRAATDPMEDLSLPKIAIKSRMTRSAVEISDGHLLPVYQPGKEDEVNIQRSATPNSFNSTTRVKQLPLPQVKSQEMIHANSPRGVKTVSISGDRYLGTANSLPSRSRESIGGSVHKSYPQFEAPSSPRREQVKRFEEEQANLHYTRTLKRKSEIMSHRVNRMYYLSGSSVPVQGRYDVDESELERLREFSRARSSRANSGRLSSRSGRSFTESSLLSEVRGIRCPRGSERYTPLSRDENPDLSVQGSGVGQIGDEVRGQSRSDGGQSEGQNGGVSGRTSSSATAAAGEGVDETDNTKHKNTDDNEEKCSECKQDMKHSENEKTSPNRTGGDNDKTETKQTDSGTQDDKEGVKSSEGLKSEGDDIEGGKVKEGAESGKDEVVSDSRTEGKADEERRINGDGGEGKEQRSKDDINEAKKGGEREGDDDQSNGAKDNSAANGASNKLGGGGGDADGCHGDRTNEDDAGGGGDAVDKSGKDGDVSKTQEDGDGEEKKGGEKNKEVGEGANVELSASDDANDSHIQSIAPGLNLNKMPYNMKKSDVYLTEFSNPKTAHLSPMTSDDEDDAYSQSYDGSRPSTSHYRDGAPPPDSDNGELARMERELKTKSDALTQGIDNVGRLAESEYDRSEFGEDGDVDPTAEGYDSGVFAKAKSEEERKRAVQLRRERREARSEAKARAAEAQARRDGKSESAWAKKKSTPTPKFKVDEVYNFISSRQRAIFSEKFRELDADGNGQITVKELSKKMHKEAPKEDIQQLHKVFDLNKDKTIDEREFVTVAALNDKLRGSEVSSESAALELNLDKLGLHITAYKEMFDVMDQNQDGRLSIEEIMLIVSLSVGMEIGTDPEVVRHVHATIDKDGNGSIDFIEFLSYIPFFLQIHQQIIGKPVTVNEVEEARIAVRKALAR